MSNNKKIKLHILSEKLYPLWLTKNLVMYMGGVKLCDRIDWHKSTRRCLYVKSLADAYRIVDLQVTYPDGAVPSFKTDEMLEETINEQQMMWDIE
ncbi:LEF-6 [Betabaculovirus altermyunipunctae]|uniref:LEF-6 n=1 Tax=Betabaculovirus altermyunipunctae TaxID=3051996 RepID=A0A1S5YED3_9BBAC|nr:LEF-6 [Betabaculovirus altermyunipunctae]AQQ80348.1 LEF-6 [Betabaculovirus altermyunipunctae]